jgi:hypothetical protein
VAVRRSKMRHCVCDFVSFFVSVIATRITAVLLESFLRFGWDLFRVWLLGVLKQMVK